MSGVMGEPPNNIRGPVEASEEGSSYVDISPEWREELLDPAGWSKILGTFASTTKLAVALTDPEGRTLGHCHNPQPVWRLAREAKPEADGECPFCLAPAVFCTAVKDAIRIGAAVMVEDRAGLAHIAVPLCLGSQPLGALIAGQVFARYPEPLPLQRVAREFGISAQQLWQEAIRQVPVARATLLLYADLLLSFGGAFLGQRYAAILQRKLAQTGKRYRLLVDGIRDYAIFTLDRAGGVSSWNRGAERVFGYTEAEMIGQDYAALMVPEHDRDRLERAKSDACRLGSVDYDGWRIRKDGSSFFASCVLASMGKGDNCEYGLLIHDVTELRQSEEDQRQAQKLEGIGVLAGGIAHDFNNLLTGIMGSLSFVKTCLPADNAASSMVEIAEQSSVRAAELVGQLLAYAGKGQFVITRFDFSALISEMVPLIAASIPKTVELELSLTPGLPWIEADASQIRQIVMNLIINGAEAIGAEGGKVRVSTGVLSLGAEVFMEVRDSGSGMTEATKAKIFDPFFTTKFTGRGLGLAAVSGIVRGHHGKMHVDSIPGQGTTFTVSFPAVEPEVSEQVKSASSVIPHGTGTILVVDDDPMVRQLAGTILEESGYSVLAAADGREAVDMFRKNPAEIAAVLLDITMPVMGGYEAFRLIREIQPGVPIIMSSGYTEIAAREELGCGTVAGFIKKPWVAAELVENIQAALQPAVAQ